ncbi:MAG: bifunctional diaminohydroxyphosphoribosylaminopyrimidine deaminase/5-amino-6-(5-phosphoribosylamino)uracil reductase RibD [Sulfuricurvum sp.]|nr:bifunctional diaminohydroxyphosphoribosylaminopyrimidine deaminase/5-amino-6-(5-phosphoribosylamino)uracil reductase RibD [Sulfuricurvum sp.]
MNTASNLSPMDLALKAAWDYQLLTFPNPAVGAVCIGEHGEILSVAAHKKAGGPHAEIYALRDAYARLSGDTTLVDCDDSSLIHTYLRDNHNNCFKSVSMAVTLEPCAHHGKTPSCAALIRDLGIKKITLSCMDPNPLAAGGSHLLRVAGVECTVGEAALEGENLLAPFVAWQTKPFVFFKWAQRLDGSVDGGIISSNASLQHVHRLRDKCDLIVIGGNTVRMDRPTLDARMVNGKAPDVLIYTRQSDFDRTIPLFNVSDRRVFIESSLERIREYSLVLIEGGAAMMEATREVCDWYVCYIAPKVGGGLATIGHRQEDFEVMSAKIQEDIILWMKRKG